MILYLNMYTRLKCSKLRCFIFHIIGDKHNIIFAKAKEIKKPKNFTEGQAKKYPTI